MKLTYTCAQVEIGGKHAKAHVQAFFIVSEPLNKKGMVKVVQHLFGKDGDGNFSSHLSWPPLGSTTDSRVYCTKPDNSDREWVAGDRAVGTEPYEYGLFEEIEGHQIAQGDRSDLRDILDFVEEDPTISFVDMLDHFRGEAEALAEEVAVYNESKPRRITPTPVASPHCGIAFWPTASPAHYSHLGSIWREWEVRSERDLHEYLWNALSRVRQERRPFVRFFKLLSRKPEMQGNLFRYSKGRNTRFRVQNGCLHFCRASEEPTRTCHEVREYCPDCAPNACDIVHQHPYSGRCFCRRSSPLDYSD